MKHQHRRRACRKQHPLVRLLSESLAATIRESVEEQFPVLFREHGEVWFRGHDYPYIHMWESLCADETAVKERKLSDMVAEWLRDSCDEHAMPDAAQWADNVGRELERLAKRCRKHAAALRGSVRDGSGATRSRI